MALRRFWFEFDADARYGCQLPFACGVTAWTEDEALGLIAETFCDGGEVPSRRRVIADVDIGGLLAELEPRIGRLDTGVPVTPGIWFPHVNNP